MSNVVFSSLKTAVKGTALLFMSSAVSLALWFFIKILIIRNVTQAEFGIYSLALTVLAIACVFVSLGLFEGTARYISIAHGEGDSEKIKRITKSVLETVFFLGIAATAIFYLIADVLSIRVFNMPALAMPLKTIAIGVIITLFLDLCMALFRGHGIMSVKATVDVAQPGLYMAFLAIVVLLRLPFMTVMIAYVIASALSLVGVLIYSYRRLNLGDVLFRQVNTCRRELIVFSVPLLGVAITGLIMAWTDTLMLGYFMQAEDVGIYNAGISLAKLLMFAVTIFNFVFMPIAGELYIKGNMDDFRRTYQVLTKWVFMISFPIFLVLFFFPEMTLTFLFGQQYEASATVLKLLSLNFMIILFAGSSGLVLTVIGETRLLMWIAIAGAVLNIVFNFTFIPKYGIEGAAMATLLSNFIGTIICAELLYLRKKIHPFTISYIKPIIGSALIASLIYIIAKSLPLYFWMLPVYCALFITGYLISIFITRSIEKEDIKMFEAVTWRMGVELTFIKKLLRRFAHE